MNLVILTLHKRPAVFHLNNSSIVKRCMKIITVYYRKLLIPFKIPLSNNSFSLV